MFEKLEELAKNNKKISDFHIRSGWPLAYRQTGEIYKVKEVMVKPQDLMDLMSSNCNEVETKRFQETHELDSSVTLSGLRFRANFYKTITGPAAVLRRNYGFVQVYFSPTDTNLTVISRGMTQSTLAQKVSNGEFQNASSEEKCDLDGDFWDDDGRQSRKPEVGYLELGKVATDIDGPGAICFSKDGRWYSASSSFLNNTTPISSLYICERNAEECLGDDGNLKEMCVNVEEKENCIEHLYVVSWSRFGNIRLEKYNGRTDEWINQ